QWPRLRVVDIARAVARPVDLLIQTETQDARHDERLLHRMFAAKRRRFGCGDGCTEWFELDPLEAFYLLILLLPVDEFEKLVQVIFASKGLAADANFFPLCLTRRRAKEYLECFNIMGTRLEDMIRMGALKPFGRGRGWRVRGVDLDAFIRRLAL